MNWAHLFQSRVLRDIRGGKAWSGQWTPWPLCPRRGPRGWWSSFSLPASFEAVSRVSSRTPSRSTSPAGCWSPTGTKMDRDWVNGYKNNFLNMKCGDDGQGRREWLGGGCFGQGLAGWPTMQQAARRPGGRVSPAGGRAGMEGPASCWVTAALLERGLRCRPEPAGTGGSGACPWEACFP